VIVKEGKFMSDMDLIKQIAEETIAGSSKWLWDRTRRIVRNCKLICGLDEVTAANLPIERFCLTAAAYFADAGFIRFAESGQCPNGVILSELNVNDLRKFSTSIVADKLAETDLEAKIDKINLIIMESSTINSKLAEARILSDARGLDDMGAVGVFNEFRKYAFHGDGPSDSLVGWKRKIDYRYWQSRLDESFSFESVANIAKRRFATAETFMNHLADENSGRDIEEMILE
jgi:hypothetical protein